MCDPEIAVPPDREQCVTSMEPVKIKKELEDYSNLIKVFGENSAFVRERKPFGSWRSRVPTAVLEELESMSGWARSEENNQFSISLSGGHPDLVLSDEVAAA